MTTSACEPRCPFSQNGAPCDQNCALQDDGRCSLVTLAQAAASIAEDVRVDSPRITRSLENMESDLSEIRRRR